MRASPDRSASELPDPPDLQLPVSLPNEGFDRWLHAQIGRASAGVSPAALLLAQTDWLAHLALSPAKQVELVHKAWRKALRLALYLPQAMRSEAARCIEPLPQDHRFDDPAWQQWPFNALAQSFLLTQQWWHNATTGVRGVSRHHEDVVSFVARQLLDLVSPGNFVPSNPAALQRALASGGGSLMQGAQHWWEDVQRRIAGRPYAGMDAWRVGENLACTPGRVVMRNALAELIQYTPTTAKVHPEPVLIVPAWIMKYYVLDLAPQRSLIEYLVGQGHTVFCVSWKNPGAAERDFGLDDYLQLGLFEALRTVEAIVPRRPVHAAGYCLGGTLLAIGAAALARDGSERLASVSLLAAQTDFSEPGEIALFIDDSEVTFLEDLMFDRGYLSADQMAGAFQLLRSNDLIWSRAVRDYLMGERAPVSDLMAWNADATRMPYRMHSQYLHRLFLRNDLAAARFRVADRPVALSDIRVPVFALGTELDHVAPWRSVYKLMLLCDADARFVLASGGHNTGVVNPPRRGEASRGHHRVLDRPAGGRYVDPDQFLALAQDHEGSWWPLWQQWLAAHSSRPVAVPRTAPRGSATFGAAPGRYVLET
ncbi:PHA/PHB synthase family protein [Aquabacterium humicola]|uniref:PHA/PHB synthase family protein n=1 Tax=Aquabacterium humicola TaxID=3237377 RepID=UPI002542E2B4|nr:alpha/beta fold hydrolase [Rubrivivax pictus]